MGPRTRVGGPTAQASFPRPSWVSYTVTCHSADAWPRFEGPAAHSGHTSPWLPGQSQVCLLTSGSPTCPGPLEGSLKYPQVYTPGAHSQDSYSNLQPPQSWLLWPVGTTQCWELAEAPQKAKDRLVPAASAPGPGPRATVCLILVWSGQRWQVNHPHSISFSLVQHGTGETWSSP